MEIPNGLSAEFQKKLVEHGFTKSQAASSTAHMAFELFADMDSKEILGEMRREAKEVSSAVCKLNGELLEVKGLIIQAERRYKELKVEIATAKKEIMQLNEEMSSNLTDERAKNAIALYCSVKKLNGGQAEQSASYITYAYLAGQLTNATQYAPKIPKSE